MAKNNPIVILRGHKTSVFPSDSEARPYYERVKDVPAIFYKCGTIEEGMRDLITFKKWEAIAPEFKQCILSVIEAKAIIQAMLTDEGKFVAEQLAEVERERDEKLAEEARIKSQPTMEERSIAANKSAHEREMRKIQEENDRRFKNLIFDCELGVKGASSSVSGPSGTVYVEHEKGAKVPLKCLTLGEAALKQSAKAINAGAETVKILGLGGSVVKTLTQWAPKWKTEGWVKPNGQPRPNAGLVREMLELYEPIKSKVSFGDNTAQKALVDDDAPF